MKIRFSAFIITAMIHGYAAAEAFHFDAVTYQGSTYQTAELDLKEADLKLFWKKSDGTAYESLNALRAGLQADGKSFLMATNSGIYQRDYTPMGLHVERGNILHAINLSHASTGNFFMIPNGVFAITESGARIFEAGEYVKAKIHPLEAAQSGPLLLNHGKVHERFKEDSDNKKRRSGVGVTADGHVIFALSDGAVGFYEFATLFKEILHCPDALYLDGTIPSLLARDKPADVQLVPFVGMWAAVRRR